MRGKARPRTACPALICARLTGADAHERARAGSGTGIDGRRDPVAVPRSRLTRAPRPRSAADRGSTRCSTLPVRPAWCWSGGPPGVGKTSAVAHWAITLDAPVAWYRAVATAAPRSPPPADRPRPPRRRARRRAGRPGRRAPDGGSPVDDLVLRLERAPRPPVRRRRRRPPARPGGPGPPRGVRPSTYRPGLPGAGRARAYRAGTSPAGELAGQIVLDQHDLRFRPWEVETLFREQYGIPLGSADAVELTRRTGGWAAGSGAAARRAAAARPGRGRPGPGGTHRTGALRLDLSRGPGVRRRQPG